MCVCFCPFVNQVLTISCYCVPFQSLNCRCIRCHVRCVLFMFLVYMLTLISFFFFFLPCYGVEVNTAEDIQVQPPHSLGSFWLAVGSFHPTLPFEHTESLLFWGTAYLFLPFCRRLSFLHTKYRAQPVSFFMMGSLRLGWDREREKGNIWKGAGSKKVFVFIYLE